VPPNQGRVAFGFSLLTMKDEDMLLLFFVLAKDPSLAVLAVSVLARLGFKAQATDEISMFFV